MKVVGERERAEQKAIAGSVYSIKFPAGRGAPSLGLNTRLHYNKSHPTFQPFALSPPAPRPKKTALEFFLSPTRRHSLPALPFATSLLCAFLFAVPKCISQTLFHTSTLPSASDVAPTLARVQSRVQPDCSYILTLCCIKYAGPLGPLGLFESREDRNIFMTTFSYDRILHAHCATF